MTRLWVLVLAVAGVAHAEGVGKPGIMAAPLAIRRVPAGVTAADQERLQREFIRQLKLAGAAVPEFARFTAALEDFTRQDCDRDDGCLVQLAKKAETLYGLFASVDVTVEGVVVVQARIVRDDGEVVRPLISASRPRGKEPFVDAARAPLVDALKRLDLGSLAVQRPVAVKPPALVPPVVEPPPPAPVVEAPPPPAPLVVVAPPPTGPPAAALALIISGGTVTLVGAALGLVGLVMGSTLQTTGGLLRDAGDVRRAQTAGTLATSGLIGLGLGTAALAAGLIVLLTSGPAVAIVPVDGGGVMAFGGAF